jgi:hypothetical protein
MTRETGFRGLWSFEGSLTTDQPWRYVHYSGGLGTAFQQHVPVAAFDARTRRTYFCCSGEAGPGRLRCLVSFYDHDARTVEPPAVVIEKPTDDAHDNASIALDPDGRVWVFSSAHGTLRPSYVFRGREPGSIDEFELVRQDAFSYAQPWVVDGRFLLLHTRYTDRRRYLFCAVSADGRTWREPRPLAVMGRGHYQVSGRCGGRVATAFNRHPGQPGADDDVGRTDLYYLETADGGRTWTTVAGEAVSLPLAVAETPARVRDYHREGEMVYLKDLNFDAEGRPVILYLLSRGGSAGPDAGPRRWHTARWDGSAWEVREAMRSDNNFDTGCLHVASGGAWRVIAPTGPGPQAFNAGGQVEVWASDDCGVTWHRQRVLTADAARNHTFVRRPADAHEDFGAIWADGDTRRRSASDFYFCDAAGRRAFRLPRQMTGPTPPEPLPAHDVGGA